MERYSRAAVMLLEEGAFWSEPKDAKYWREAIRPQDMHRMSAEGWIGKVKQRGF